MAERIPANTITKHAIEVLKYKRYMVWRHNQVKVPGRAFIGLKGVPDIIGYSSEGKAVYCEVKAKGDHFSECQKTFLQTAINAGCLVYTATQEGNEIVVKQLIQID